MHSSDERSSQVRPADPNGGCRPDLWGAAAVLGVRLVHGASQHQRQQQFAIPRILARGLPSPLGLSAPGGCRMPPSLAGEALTLGSRGPGHGERGNDVGASHLRPSPSRQPTGEDRVARQWVEQPAGPGAGAFRRASTDHLAPGAQRLELAPAGSGVGQRAPLSAPWLLGSPRVWGQGLRRRVGPGQVDHRMRRGGHPAGGALLDS
jgi:hypothetical protein